MASKIILASRYAKALWESTKDSAEVSTWVKELESLLALLHSSPQLLKSISSPQFTTEAKTSVLEAFCEKLEISASLKKFLVFVLESGRIETLSEILNILKSNLLTASQTARAVVKSAMPLSAAQQKQLTDALEHQTKKKIKIELHVDPDLIAGLQVVVSGKTLDASLSACLASLSQKLKDAKFERNVEGNV